MNGNPSDIEAHLRAYLACQTTISSAALGEANTDSFLSESSEALAATLAAPLVGFFAPQTEGLALVSGCGWRPHIRPQTLPSRSELAPPTRGARRLNERAALASARLLRAHDIDDGIVCEVALPRGEVGLLGVFGGSQINAPEAIALVGAAAELIAAGLARRDLADRLLASERRLNEAQELAHLGSYDWDIVTDTNTWSDELYRIYGAEPGEFNASYDQFLARIHPDDREKVMAVHQQAFETLEPYQMVERVIRPDGEVRILATTGEVVADDNGTPVRMRGICLDMTDRLEAEQHREALGRAEDRRRQAFHINDGVVQGLTSVIWAIEEGVHDAALIAATETLNSARAMMRGLLEGDSEGDLSELTRREAPVSVLADRWHATEPPAPMEKPAASVRLVVADDSDDLRLLLSMQIALRDGWDLVGEAASGPDAIDVVARTSPDVLLLDMAMPGGNGLDAIPELRRCSPDTTIIVLSGFSRSHLAEQALAAGADAYVEKGSIDALWDTLATIVSDGISTPSGTR